ncbi:MAG: tetratricopeptide repeat protein [Armatimonadota bacterium]
MHLFRQWSLLLLCLMLACLSHAAEVTPQHLLLLRGTIALADGRADEACADLREAASITPEDWHTQLVYAEALQQAGLKADAKAQFRRAMLLAPSRPEVWTAMARAGRALNDANFELAALAGAMRIFPEDPQLQRRMAEVYRALGQRAAAEKLDTAWQASLPPMKLGGRYLYQNKPAGLLDLRRLIEDDPNNMDILAALAAAEWQATNRNAARDALKRLIVLQPRDATVIGNYAYVCMMTGQMDDALQTLKTAAPLGNYLLDHSLALWSMSTGHYADAIAPLQRLLLRNPVDALLNRELGVAAMLCGEQDTALAALRIAWLKDGSHLSGQHYAEALLIDGRVEDAEEVLQTAITNSPQETLPKVQLSLLYRDMGRLGDCAQLTMELVRQRSERVELTMLAGERFLRSGHISRAYTMVCELRDKYPADPVAMKAAVEQFRRLGALPEGRLVLTRYLSPGFKSPISKPDILLAVARYAAESNQIQEAIMALDEILKLEPTFRSAYQLQGKLLVQQARWADAMRLYARALTRWKDDPEFILALARAAVQAGNYPMALHAYRQVCALNTNADPLLEFGQLYHAQGDEAQARENWQAAEKLPGGKIRAHLFLLASYDAAGETARAEETLTHLLAVLDEERTARAEHWQSVLTPRGITLTAKETNALLLLEPDLTDPAPLLARREAAPAVE